jgi:DNA-binding IclR family transcriptional regulator
MKSKPGAQANQSIIDGIAVLQALAMSEEPVGSRELARRLGMETTRVNRLLKTLAYIGITQQTANRKYIPGSGMHVLASQSLYASKLLRCAITPLEKLSYFGHTVALGVLWQDSVSYLYHQRPGMASSEAIGRIGLRPATTSGIGMVLLASSAADDVLHIYQDKEILGFPDGVDSLMTRLADVRQMGYARVLVDSEKPPRPGKPTHTVAIPVGNPVSSGIAISGWIPETSINEIVTALNQTRTAIEAAMASPIK